jgi:hypothetical protein
MSFPPKKGFTARKAIDDETTRRIRFVAKVTKIVINGVWEWVDPRSAVW